MVALGVALVACGGGGGTFGGPKAISIQGSWVTSTSPAARGRLILTAIAEVKSAAEGPLSGTLLLTEGDGPQVEVPVTGSFVPSGTGTANLYWELTFSSADGALSFAAACYDGVDRSSVIVGSFTDARAGTPVAGRWRSSPVDGPAEPIIDRTFAQTGFTFLDLAWDGAKLLAVATPAGGSTGVFELDTSGSTLVAKPVTLSPPVIGPTGIAWDGTRTWIVSPGPDFTFQLNAYDASWADALAGAAPKGPGGSPRDQPSWIAAWGGALWTADVLNSGATRIDPSTAAKTRVESLVLSRTVGADHDGSLVWSASYPPGGVWPSLDAYAPTGPLVRSIYAPEGEVSTPAPVAVACEGTGFVWMASPTNLYRLDAR